MSLLRKVDPDEKEDLERVIKGLFMPQEKLNFIQGSPDISVYFLYVEPQGNRTKGFFDGPDGLFEAPIGLSRRSGFLSAVYFSFNSAGNLQSEEPQKGTLYLPLELTEHRAVIGTKKEDKFTPLEGSPFRLFGIKGTAEKYPILFGTYTEEGVDTRALYYTLDKKVKPFIYYANSPIIRSILRQHYDV